MAIKFNFVEDLVDQIAVSVQAVQFYFFIHHILASQAPTFGPGVRPTSYVPQSCISRGARAYNPICVRAVVVPTTILLATQLASQTAIKRGAMTEVITIYILGRRR